DEKKLTLAVENDGPIPAAITTDPTRLRQILINLIGNAIKFTASGAVTVTLRHQVDGPARSKLLFLVADTGIGMTGAEISQLFEPFTQADASSTRRFGGTGLGLAISRRLARALGGDILVSSIPGIGSIFRLELPTHCVAALPLCRPTPASESGDILAASGQNNCRGTPLPLETRQAQPAESAATARR